MPAEPLLEYQRIWVEGLNRGDVSAADAAFAPDCVVHITGVPAPLRGVGAWKELVAGMLAAFPDLHFTMEHQLVDGDRVAHRWHATGTHTGPLGPVPPTGKAMAIDGLIFSIASSAARYRSAGNSGISRSCSNSWGSPDLPAR